MLGLIELPEALVIFAGVLILFEFRDPHGELPWAIRIGPHKNWDEWFDKAVSLGITAFGGVAVILFLEFVVWK